MYLGIDLGTSNSAVAGHDGVNVRLFKTAEGTDVLPSVVYMDRRGHKFVGSRAYAKTILSPTNVAQRFKRLMGTGSRISFADAKKEVSPEDCSADVIRTLVAQARTESGGTDVTGTVVTIPAAFNQMQIEATTRAATAAGLNQVCLLQEPIAAAMATLAQSRNRNGQFLIYDLGGGTFDVALVQSVKGVVNVIEHEGINMLGGQDFDRVLVDEYVRPWLAENFKIPEDFQRDDRFRRLTSAVRQATERAKIQLSQADSAVILADEDEVGVEDSKGKPMFLSIDIGRRELDSAVCDRLDETIELCRKVIESSGFSHEDVDRVVLIGGPSKMATVRERVPQELGIPADVETDPMTAVAIGAAIYAESREWSEHGTRRKKVRASTGARGAVPVRFIFPARVSTDRAKIGIVLPGGVNVRGYEFQIDTAHGWTSGRVPLAETSVEVPVERQGANAYRVTVYDATGTPMQDSCSDMSIVRSYASAAGIPATHTLSVKVVGTRSGEERNELEPLVEKGTLLPAKGTTRFRAARELRGSQPGQIDVEFFQQEEAVPEPELNLFVGSFQLNAVADLDAGDVIRKGDELLVRWSMDDNGLLRCAVSIPSLGRELDGRNFYTSTAGHQNFDGDDGVALATSILDDADREIGEIESALGDNVKVSVTKLRRRLSRQRAALGDSVEADLRRSAVEEGRSIRQDELAPFSWTVVR